MKHLHIIGGGLAGLSLARGLAREGVPVTVYEKNKYPRHKVCGEFITGLDANTIEQLDLEPLLSDALRHRRTAWFHRNRTLFRRELPSPALGLSRWTLDARMAASARAAGVQIEERAGLVDVPAASAEGWICATGVKREGPTHHTGSRWLGLKAHFEGLRTTEDLELHLGRRAYAGLSAIENERVNVCMLMDTNGCRPEDCRSLENALEAVGLSALANRLRGAQCIPGSRTATAGLVLNSPHAEDEAVVLGDGLGMIPPFTGHGMAMAFRSSALALEPLLHYANGNDDWPTCRREIRQCIQNAHTRRLRSARLLHPLLLQPGLQRLAARFSASPFFPWRTLYQLTHQ